MRHKSLDDSKDDRLVSTVLSSNEYVSIARTRFYIRLWVLEEYDLLFTPQKPLAARGVDDWPAQNECNPTPSIFDRLPFTFPFYPAG